MMDVNQNKRGSDLDVKKLIHHEDSQPAEHIAQRGCAFLCSSLGFSQDLTG